MNTSTFTVSGTWRRASSSADTDLDAQLITGTHVPFALPAAPEPVRAARTPHGATTDAIDDFFGVTRPRATREGRHDSYPSLQPSAEMPPPPYADAALPAYTAEPNTEPVTLAMYLFKFGFLFPPFWILGAIIWMSPLTAPADFEPSKSERERAQLVQTIRSAEVRWAKRCAWVLVALVVLVGVVLAVTLAVVHS